MKSYFLFIHDPLGTKNLLVATGELKDFNEVNKGYVFLSLQILLKKD